MRTYFTELERAHLAGGHEETELLRIWTRKEALLKATGEGLAVHPRKVEVVAPEPLPQWRLFDLDPAAGYVGAMAVAREVKRC